MERVVNKAGSFEEAERWNRAQLHRLTPEERQRIAKELRERCYGKDRPDVRAAQRAE